MAGAIGHPEIVQRVVPVRQVGQGWPGVTSCSAGPGPDRAVISLLTGTGLERKSFVAWYRNPSRATLSALRIAYQDDAGKWGSLQVDFVIISRRDNGSLAASIVDPHGDHLADAKAKLRGLADFAEKFGEYIRIESIAKVTDGQLRSLDLLTPRSVTLCESSRVEK